MEGLARRGQKIGFRHTAETKAQISATMAGRAPLAIHIKKACPTCGILMGVGNLGRHAPACAAKSATGLFPDKTVKQVKAIRRRLKQYGLSADGYARLWAAQGGVCAICGGDNESRALAVDHDHRNGKVRGLLCDHCNLLLGYAHDRRPVLIRAEQYLEGHGRCLPESCDTPEFDPWKD